ncbi:YbaB/EbfC family nucleoid-associated protein [Nocardia sp. CDC159]|uniref:YbaB/EbfC family nucleoid-associated protein n=1 Tax=Nocardia pulmonis TaxID=2951408 RepID=A0A9X2J103_9NOCA|nr:MULTISPECIES: YbaB/EbfC family nucleoid-associated protein [Nocardia]MCM6777595.1 YbaB/EbfC family nucleoid-associated protein [Nocardia pulmonis]MCM6790601.1 YbaB/EbfC family nucleoid-associated protein [Nocardia sp. CDC159]
MASQYDELGLKVQRAQYELEQIRGSGTVDGVTVEVDAENRLISVDVPGGETIVAAYRAALRDIEPKVAEATRELFADPQVQSARVFAEANSARLEAERRAQQQSEDASGGSYLKNSW